MTPDERRALEKRCTCTDDVTMALCPVHGLEADAIMRDAPTTEPEEGPVERVARWLHENRVTCLAATSNPEPAIDAYLSTARNLLHDTGILTTESETP